jgi:hypothetical protein
MRSKDENCTQAEKGEKQGTKLIFSPKLVLKEVSPLYHLDLPYLHVDCWLVFFTLSSLLRIKF